MTALRTSLLLLLLGAAAAAQSHHPPPPLADGKGATARGLVVNGQPVSEEAAAQLTADEQRRSAAIAAMPSPVPPSTALPSGAHLFTPTAMVRPHRLAPGERGTVHVVVTLAKGVVVLPGGTARVELTKGAAPMRFGKAVLEPAPTGAPGTRYAGQPVYTETLTFVAPVTIDADAAAGDHGIKGTVELSLCDAATATPLGVFAAPVGGTAKVGAPLPKPAGALEAAAPQVPPEPAPAADPVAGPPESSGTLTWLLLVGCGCVGLLLWRHTRR